MASNYNGGDPQAARRAAAAAAAAYDYEGDPRWAEFWHNNVLIPPHMASRPDIVDYYKRKFYQRFIDPDFAVETMSSSSSSQAAGESSSSSSAAAQNARSHNPGSFSATSSMSGRNRSSMQLDRRTILFSVNAWVLALAIIGVFPLVPRTLSNKAYRLSLWGTAASCLYSLYTLYGKPRTWRLPAIQAWFQTMFATKDFIRFIYCLMFATSPIYLEIVFIPVICRALEHVSQFLRRNFIRSSFYRRYLGAPCLWVEANSSALNFLSSNAEIALGLLLIVSLFSWQHNVLQTFMYWQLLKLMYHAPATAGYHRQVWATIGRSIRPYIYRYAPFLSTPISAVQRWWFR